MRCALPLGVITWNSHNLEHSVSFLPRAVTCQIIFDVSRELGLSLGLLRRVQFIPRNTPARVTTRGMESSVGVPPAKRKKNSGAGKARATRTMVGDDETLKAAATRVVDGGETFRGVAADTKISLGRLHRCATHTCTTHHAPHTTHNTQHTTHNTQHTTGLPGT
jgi:hypothetical protein